MKEAHAAAAYTKWLKAEVRDALDDTSPTIPHDEAMRQVRAAIKLPKMPETVDFYPPRPIEFYPIVG